VSLALLIDVLAMRVQKRLHHFFLRRLLRNQNGKRECVVERLLAASGRLSN
jgi:hypothetical protein